MSGSVTPQEIVNEVRDGLRLTLTCAAARADVGDDTGRRIALQVALSLAIPAYQQTGNPQPAIDAVYEAMGPDWRPSGEWAEYIEAASQI